MSTDVYARVGEVCRALRTFLGAEVHHPDGPETAAWPAGDLDHLRLDDRREGAHEATGGAT